MNGADGPEDAAHRERGSGSGPDAANGRGQAPNPRRGAVGLDAHLVVERPAGRGGARRGAVPGFRLDVRLRAAEGEVVALLGPNGAGKTTALRALAGLTPLAGGHLRLDGRPLEGAPPESRPVGVVFQDYLLFPHLSALDNVAFGPRCQGRGRAEARVEARSWLERMGLAEHAATRPRHLSGGQAQRVALARALATRPRLLLLDEPLAALDARTRLRVRSQLRRHLADFEAVAVLVTHDPLDAMVLADRLLVIEDGRVVQDGVVAEVARQPRTDYLAHLVGLNLLRGRAEGRTVRLAGGVRLVTGAEQRGPVLVALPPDAVTLHRERPNHAGSPHAWRAEVVGLEPWWDRVRVELGGRLPLTAEVGGAQVAALDLAPGAPVWATVEDGRAHAYPE